MFREKEHRLFGDCHCVRWDLRELEGYEQWVCIDKFHQHTVTSLVNGSWNGEAVLMKNLGRDDETGGSGQIVAQTFIKAHSFWAARRDIYIQEADFLFPR